MTPALRSASRTGVQSAVTTPSASPGRAVTSASARGPAPGGQGSVTVTTPAPCTWVRPSRCGGAEGCGRRRRGWRATASGASALERLQFRLANGPVLTPPRRVKKPWRTGRASLASASGVIRRTRPGPARRGGPTAMALNSRPMWAGSARRWAAAISAAARPGGCVRASRSVRWNRPSRARNMPCGIGPCTAAPAASAVRRRAAKSTCAVRSASPGSASGSAGAPSRIACSVSAGPLSAAP